MIVISETSISRFPVIVSLRPVAVCWSFVFCILAIGQSLMAETADTIYHNGHILTMDGDKPAYVDALVAKDGKILLTGARDQALSMKGDSTRVVDLDRKALLPGFLDGHSHYINSLLVAN